MAWMMCAPPLRHYCHCTPDVAKLICNYIGEEALYNEMPWSGQTAFNEAPEMAYLVDGVQVNTARSAANLSFLKIENAGHMVPMGALEALLAAALALTWQTSLWWPSACSTLLSETFLSRLQQNSDEYNLFVHLVSACS